MYKTHEPRWPQPTEAIMTVTSTADLAPLKWAVTGRSPRCFLLSGNCYLFEILTSYHLVPGLASENITLPCLQVMLETLIFKSRGQKMLRKRFRLFLRSRITYHIIKKKNRKYRRIQPLLFLLWYLQRTTVLQIKKEFTLELVIHVNVILNSLYNFFWAKDIPSKIKLSNARMAFNSYYQKLHMQSYLVFPFLSFWVSSSVSWSIICFGVANFVLYLTLYLEEFEHKFQGLGHLGL